MKSKNIVMGILLFIATIFAICLYCGQLVNAADIPPQTINIASGDLDWKQIIIVALIVFFPTLLAMTLTVVTTTVWRKNKIRRMIQIYEWDIYIAAAKSGLIFGPTCQSGLQGMLAYIFNLPVFWELIPLSIVIVGPASLVWYELLRWATFKYKIYRVYAWLSIKKLNVETKEIENTDGDVTRLAALLKQGESTTIKTIKLK